MELKLVKKVNETKDVASFFFDKPKGFEFQAGQYIYLTLPKLNYPDERGATRHFTISSSPTEDGIVRITTRMREESGYKKTLDELPIGTVIDVKGPQGTFVLDSSHLLPSASVFLAGGIGITPFRSFIKYSVDSNQKSPMYLIYSNSDDDFIFKQELDIWQKENDFLKITYFDSSVSGHLDAVKLSSLLPKTYSLLPNFWAVGPNVFVNAMEEILEEMKIPEGNIKTEKFTGY